jgi:hypothetical protein
MTAQGADTMTMNRKQFIERLGAGGVLLVLQACGGGGGGSGPGFVSAKCSATGAAVSSNHGHSLLIEAADLDLTTSKSYNIQGTAGHNHTVTLSAGNFATLKAGGTVTIDSSTTNAPAPFGLHFHTLTVTCV